MPGGYNKYVDSLRRCLEFVKQNTPTREQLTGWFSEAFPLGRKKRVRAKKTVDDYVCTIKNLQLIRESNGSFLLSEVSKKYLETYDSLLLYRQLDMNYIGIYDIIELFYKQPLTIKETCSSLSEKIEVRWEKPTQCRARINWLQSLGYVAKDGTVYRLTEEGRSIVESKSEQEEGHPGHGEIKDIIVELGKVYNLFTGKEYPVNGYLLDVVWKKRKGGYPSVAFEVELSGNLHKALLKLKSAWVNYSSKLFLITTIKDKLKAESIVNSSLREIEDDMRILTFDDLEVWYEKVKTASDHTAKSGFKGIGVRFRKAKHVSKERKPNDALTISC